MTNPPDVVEFWLRGQDRPFMRLYSSMPPRTKCTVSISKETYKVVEVQYAVDYSDKVFERHMRANVIVVKLRDGE